MLDDFKTELKRLGIKRLQQDELRRKSLALVLDDNSKDGDDDDNSGGHRQLEFSDALNVNPARFQTLESIDTSSSRSSPSGGRLRQESVARDARNESRDFVGHSAKKISRLPGLKDFKFDYKRAAGKKKAAAAAGPDDEEKQRAQAAGTAAADDDGHSPPAVPDRLSQMRKSLGVIDYHPR